MYGDGPIVKRAVLPGGAVDELVAQDEGPRRYLSLQGATCPGSDDAFDPELMHAPYIGAVVDTVWGVLMLTSMAGEEGDRDTVEIPYCEAVTGSSIRGMDGIALRVRQERIEPRTTENTDFNLRQLHETPLWLI
jgi:hypothetical protein